MEPYIAIGCVIGAFTFYTFLVLKNLEDLRATKEMRLEARRAYRKARSQAWAQSVQGQLFMKELQRRRSASQGNQASHHS